MPANRCRWGCEADTTSADQRHRSERAVAAVPVTNGQCRRLILHALWRLRRLLPRCHGDAFRVLPHEEAAERQPVPHPEFPGALMRAHEADGDCVDVTDVGRSLQGDKPHVCRAMGCRRRMTRSTPARRRALLDSGGLTAELVDRAKWMLSTHGRPKLG